ncbi:thioesterase II family protein [Streptomyces virginiae]|uniref:thioesterase II family protein n=1 Tax=Streptomyces virginiae TaxID=1961 RepID=UPI0036B2ADE5
MNSTASAETWLRRLHPSPDAATRLVCLPHAGGSASFYFPLSSALAGGTEVLAVQYPGRQERLHEPAITDINQLADHVTRVLVAEADRPLALFGHSMGALVAFEVANRLEALGITVMVLFTSGGRAPSSPHSRASIHTLTDQGLVAELTAAGGTDPELLSNPEILQVILPMVRSDYQAVETYRYRPRPKLRCSIVTLFGDKDSRVGPAEAQAWAELTSGAHELHIFPGGHFYLCEQQHAVADLVRQHVERHRT